jgi:hypothetical protein
VPLRQQSFATYTSTRTVGPELADGTKEVTTVSAFEGDVTGDATATGVQVTPANGYDDIVFTGTIDGVGSGTLTMRQEWTATDTDIATTTVITGGTGDFEGITGRLFSSVDATDDPEQFTGRTTFDLVIPRSG